MKNGCVVSKVKSKMANRVDPDETDRYEPSHLDLQYLQKYSFLSTVLIKQILSVTLKLARQQYYYSMTHNIRKP